MESFFSTVKSERADRFDRYEDAKREWFDYIEVFYDQRRRHSTLDQISPAALSDARAKKAWILWKTARTRFLTGSTPVVFFDEKRTDNEERSTQRNRPLNRIMPTTTFVDTDGAPHRPRLRCRSPVKAVFDTRPETSYDDDIIRRYHFPNRYLPEARKCVGDWIVYREPQRGGGRRGYVAVARVTRIETDPTDDASSYAYVSNFLPFNMAVPFHRETGYYETRLNTIEDRSRVGVETPGAFNQDNI